jgi:hypothetical protein
MATVATFAGRGIIWNRVKNTGTGLAPLNIGWGSWVTTASQSASPNVNLFAPQTEARTPGTAAIITTTQLGDTYQVTGTVTCLVAAKTITEAALFDSPTLSGTSTLSASLTAAATTMTLGANIGPTTGAYYAQINNETVLVTGAASTTLTIQRGMISSTSAVQAVASPVTSGGDGGAGGWASGQTATFGPAQGGNMFIHADFAAISLNTNDSISFTFSDTLT